MSPGHLRFLLLEQGIGSAVVNFLLNGAIAWLVFRGVAQVPLWGQQSIAGDTIGTCFFLPFLTTLIVTPPPETAQAVAFAALQLKVTLSPLVMVDALAPKVPITAGGTTVMTTVAAGVGKPSALRQTSW